MTKEPEQITSKDGREFLDAFKEKPGTHTVYRSGLRCFLRFYRETGKGETVEDFLNTIEEDMQRPRRERERVARNVLKEFVRWLKDRKYAPKTIRTYISTIQSLASYYDIRVSTRHVSLPTSQPVSKKHPWTLEEVGEFIMGMRDPQLRSISATIFTSGISLGGVLSITWRDIKRELEAGTAPLCVDFSREKTDVPFMTFIGGWAVNLLKEYLTTVEKKRDADTIYSMSERTVENRFKKLARKLGDYEGYNPQRPHSLRSAFRTFLADAGMDHDVAEFFMGHRAPEQRRTYQSRSRGGWRKIYKKYAHALEPKEFHI